jgi:hypothetical protein
MLFLEFSGTPHGIQGPELSVPDQKQHDPPLSGEAAQVVGLQGELVAKGIGEGQTTIDFYSQPTGMYIVNVTSATGKKSQKVVKY